MEGLTLPRLQGKTSKPGSNGLAGFSMGKGKRVKGHSYTRFITQQGHRVPSRIPEKRVEGVMWGHVLTSQVPASIVFFQKCNTDIKLLLNICHSYFIY